MLCILSCTHNGKKLQACNANSKASGSVVKEALKNCNVEQVEESEMPANYLMNPFISM